MMYMIMQTLQADSRLVVSFDREAILLDAVLDAS